MEIKKALIVGHGSIGIRHLTMLNTVFSSSVEIGILRNKKFNPFQFVRYFFNKQDALMWNPDLVIIASPSCTHSEYISFFNSSHLLVEKPAVLKEDDLHLILNHDPGKMLKVGYNYRYHEEFKNLKKYVAENEIVEFKLKHSDYLPNWHPWEDFKNSDVARDGVGLTLCHGLDIILEIFGFETIKHSKTRGDINLGLNTITRFFGHVEKEKVKISWEIKCDEPSENCFYIEVKNKKGLTSKFDFNHKANVRNDTFIEQIKSVKNTLESESNFLNSTKKEHERAREIIHICQM